MGMYEDRVMFDRETRVDAIVTSIAVLIERGGMAAVTLRSVAAQTRMAHSGIAYDLGSRDRMLVVAAGVYARRMARVREDHLGAVSLLPALEDPVTPTRVWLAFGELALSNAEVAEVVAFVDDDERRLLMACPQLTGPGRIESTQALVLGLRAAICRAVAPMSVATAHELLATHLRSQGDDSGPPAPTGPAGPRSAVA